ncbi:magnesium-translocating P-type ATPase [Duganella sp. BJB1802]|uniref:magnesium-translocating P-type ATPase n=1 Tax=Duganella sp. BJB1802 TaxID=2744575 RepID=UPI00159486B8|nr:magnesium-translocating P-type ATPase [Duganella sp. BJB1802]NVD74713.1 magnesium-translocating P-type ATPase [Duganella sp. BJB1802]
MSANPPSAANAQQQALLQNYAAADPDAALRLLDSRAGGLTDQEARNRLQRTGPNAVVHQAHGNAWLRFLTLLASPLSLLLLALALVNYLTGQAWGAIVIAVMVVLSSLLAFVQEHRSDLAAERLRSMVATTASVLRDGQAGDLPLAALVPGDIVRLSAGALVPADLRILSSRDLFVSQSALTGEALPVEKHGQALAAAGLPALELGNIAFMGSTVVSGTASALVVATGARTCFGQIASDLAGARALTSFDRGVNQFVWLMIRVMIVMMPLVFLLNGLSKGDWLQALLFGVAVAVGLAPEMLPMIVTINLAKGALAMSGKQVIVKRLNAIQNFGAMDVLCTDKTGTLTQDRVIMERHVDIEGKDSARVTEYAYLNSYYQTGLKNLLDVAVLNYVDVHEHLDADHAFRKIDELPFDFQRRRMSVVVERSDGTRVLICKGAVEEVLSVCTRAETGAGVISLQDHHGVALDRVVNELNEDGFRVIAVACRELAAGETVIDNRAETDLLLVGYIAFLDPPKDSAAEALRALSHYGVAVKVLTGDNATVTRSVCRHVGLPVQQVMLGSDIDALDDAALALRAEEVSVFAKLAPQQKARVIRALQSRGHVVGYLGDGINDGAALKAADVGISVDSAVDIAKESADIILLQKSLMALKDGVVEGRKVFGNISKYLRMSASSNFGNMLSVLGASVLLPFLPMAPVQILLNNLLYDVSQTALASDHVDPGYLRRPRRWDIGNIWRNMLYLGPLSSLFDYLTFGVLWYLFDAAHQPALFQSGWFLESLLTQTLVVHVLRTGKVPFVQSKSSTALLATTLAVCALGLWLPLSSFGDALGFVTPPGGYWLALSAIVGAYLVSAQLLKSWLAHRYGQL